MEGPDGSTFSSTAEVVGLESPFLSAQFFQKGQVGARGSIQFLENGRTLISLAETADNSTFLHESGYFAARLGRRSHATRALMAQIPSPGNAAHARPPFVYTTSARGLQRSG